MKERKILLILIAIFVLADIWGIKLLAERVENINDLNQKISSMAVDNEKIDSKEKKTEAKEETKKYDLLSDKYIGESQAAYNAKCEIDDIISYNIAHVSSEGNFIALKFENFETYEELAGEMNVEVVEFSSNRKFGSGIIGIPNYKYNDSSYVRKQRFLMEDLQTCINTTKKYDISMSLNDSTEFPEMITIKEINNTYYTSYSTDNNKNKAKEKKTQKKSDNIIKEYVGTSVTGSKVKLLLEDIVASGNYIAFTYKNISTSPKEKGTIGKIGYVGTDEKVIENRKKDILAFKFYIELNKKYSVKVKYDNESGFINEVIVTENK